MVKLPALGRSEDWLGDRVVCSNVTCIHLDLLSPNHDSLSLAPRFLGRTDKATKSGAATLLVAWFTCCLPGDASLFVIYIIIAGVVSKVDDLVTS